MPDELKDLFIGDNNTSKHFRKFTRQYNNALSFISFGAELTPPSGYGLYCFKIQGMVHHKISSLYCDKKENSSYGQLYTMDFQTANDIRLSKSDHHELRSEI